MITPMMIAPTIDNTIPNTTFLSLSSLFSDGLLVGDIFVVDVMVIVGSLVVDFVVVVIDFVVVVIDFVVVVIDFVVVVIDFVVVVIDFVVVVVIVLVVVMAGGRQNPT